MKSGGETTPPRLQHILDEVWAPLLGAAKSSEKSKHERRSHVKKMVVRGLEAEQPRQIRKRIPPGSGSWGSSRLDFSANMGKRMEGINRIRCKGMSDVDGSIFRLTTWEEPTKEVAFKSADSWALALRYGPGRSRSWSWKEARIISTDNVWTRPVDCARRRR